MDEDGGCIHWTPQFVIVRVTMESRLTLYVNPAWRRAGIHTPLLNPWWGNPYKEGTSFAKQMFDTYSFDTSLYTITDTIAEADMVLPPYRYQWFLRNDMSLWHECVDAAQRANIPLFVEDSGDVEKPIDVPNVYVLRMGGYRFIPERGRIVIPPLVDDLLERCMNGELQIRKKQEGEKPVVGFAGWAELSLKQKFRAIVKELPIRLRGMFDARYRTMTKGVFWRATSIRILQASSKVRLNLKVRASFSGNVKTAQNDISVLRREFVDTILESDYGLEVRGDPNTSSRLFEICSLGRIPVVVDTERNFPFSDKIDYSSFALIVDFRDINRLPERIAEFHKNISPERFEQMQRNAREVFVNYFRIDALMRPILEELRTKMSA